MRESNVNGQMSNVVNGIYAIYKPKGPTSFRIIAELRKITGVRTIGHAGTLDPLASGVLVVAIGREFTKKIHEAVNTEKEYIATLKLGYESTTDDEEGEKFTLPSFSEKNLGGQAIPTQSDIDKIIPKFVGEINQIPPIYSAIKVGGKRLYKLARKGETAETTDIQPRRVLIKNIEVLEYKYPLLKIRVTTGKGAYIRALARDIGRGLGTGAYMSDLERTRVGNYNKDNSVTIEEFRIKLLRSKE